MVDTNVLMYAADPAEGEKRILALNLLEQLNDSGRLAVSVQVLNEFYAAATRPNKPPSLPHAEAQRIMEDIATSAMVLPLTADVTFRALDAVPRYGLAFWDALIWAAARENGVALIYTEDFQDGREIEGVRFRNPFVTTGG
jgi:predicted nucleic acid-binding protein